MAVDRNPFVTSVLALGDRFADREEELARIEAAFTDAGGKLVVYGDRRQGKSSTLEHAAARVRKRKGRVAVASFGTASDATEGAQRVLAAAQKEIGASWREVLEAVARSVRTGLEIAPSLDAAGMPTVKFTFGFDHEARDRGLLPDVLSALNEQLERRSLQLGLGLDEFQRIHEWGGEGAEWALRDAIQRHEAIAYVFAGSARHLIEAMVGSKGRALWKLAEVLRFGPIDPELLADWIVEWAAATGVRIGRADAGAIVGLAGPRTRDVVQLARAVWTLAQSAEAPPAPGFALERIVEEQAELYRTIFMRLNVRQQGVLRAFAAEPDVRITSAAANRKYRLGPKSTVQSAVETLVSHEHLVRVEGGGYGFDDPFFRRWVQLYALADIGEPAPPLPGRQPERGGW